ncbi:hypothetical protein CLV65_1065 [Pseudoscardovia suis]|uniref:Cell wall surface anchor family protein n=1 Tax=Pseudoscardovia suis TaxID=987063 RepID=A0A261F1I4_9BIFI|nr:cell wall surface anchor family protein [Pseudoscardovia suis]PJJ68488.1 hypothetical protein CLV65_1065 [Pseudoscardovia suis]
MKLFMKLFRQAYSCHVAYIIVRFCNATQPAICARAAPRSFPLPHLSAFPCTACLRYPGPYTGGMFSSHRAAKQSVGGAAPFAVRCASLCAALCLTSLGTLVPGDWAASSAGSLPTAQAATAQAASDRSDSSAENTSCAYNLALAKSWYDVSNWAPSPTQRLLMAMGARTAWSRTAALCPTAIFPEATVRAAVSQYRANRLAAAQGRQAWLTNSAFFNDSKAVMDAARSACGKDSSALDLTPTSNASGTGNDADSDSTSSNASCVSQSSAQPSQVIGATNDELNAISTAYDRAGFIMTYRDAQNSNAADLSSASTYLQGAANYAAMVTLGGEHATRNGVYFTKTISAMADSVTDPATGYKMPVGTSVQLDMVIEALSEISSSASQDASSDESKTSADSAASATNTTSAQAQKTEESQNSSDSSARSANQQTNASGSVSIGLDYTRQTITVSGTAYEPDSDGSTDPSKGLTSPAARRRAISEELSARLLSCFNAGVPAREDIVLG